MAPMYLQDLSQVKTPGHYSLRSDALGLSRWGGVSQGPGSLHGARPLETVHLLLQFPDSGRAVFLLSQRVTLLIILKGT